ncbi:thioredoxin [Flavobacteriales bacterium 34_180_T64]|nr:thioredoxin [Flavobacteriales bacterium 34_180_T64]
MKQLIIILSVLLAVSATSCNENAPSEMKAEVKLVTPEEMQTLLELDDIQLVDVRTPEEYQEGYIDNSQNIDFRSPTFDEDIIKLDKTKPVILYCRSGGRSAKCAAKLKDAGFVKIYDLDGGITKWEFEGLDIETLE